jgi:hypothetical protein
MEKCLGEEHVRSTQRQRRGPGKIRAGSRMGWIFVGEKSTKGSQTCERVRCRRESRWLRDSSYTLLNSSLFLSFTSSLSALLSTTLSRPLSVSPRQRHARPPQRAWLICKKKEAAAKANCKIASMLHTHTHLARLYTRHTAPNRPTLCRPMPRPRRPEPADSIADYTRRLLDHASALKTRTWRTSLDQLDHHHRRLLSCRFRNSTSAVTALPKSSGVRMSRTSHDGSFALDAASE